LKYIIQYISKYIISHELMSACVNGLCLQELTTTNILRNVQR